MTAEAGRRFTIRRDGALRVIYSVLGAFDGNSFAAIEGDRLRARFGILFSETFPLTAIESVDRVKWPWYLGLGWRSNLFGRIGIVGSYRDVVEIRFRERQRVSLIMPLIKHRCDRLAISLKEPDAFIAALRQAIEP